MAWQPGQSGNKRGRPKITLADGKSLAELARESTEQAVSVLIAVMQNDEAKDSDRISAANSLLDRAWGRARQSVELEVMPDQATATLLEQARKCRPACKRDPVSGVIGV